MSDPTLWTFMTVHVAMEHTNTQESEAKKESSDCITITTICTIFVFILGIISGLITYHCVSALLKRKAERQNASSLRIEINNKTAHGERGGSMEASGVYEVVNCESERPNLQMELKKNIAYGDVQY